MWTGPGFVDHHAHVLSASAGVPLPWGDGYEPQSIAGYHRSLFERGTTPMDSSPGEPAATDVQGALLGGLRRAASLGLVEITEAGVLDPRVLRALFELRERGPLPLRVRLLIASGLAERHMPSRTTDPWLDVVGVKFYADGWLGPRTCALRRPFADVPGDAGVLFLDAETLARRAAPFAEQGWTIATHAIGDRAVEAVLDAYDRIWGTGCRDAAPRIEHAQVLAPDLISRIAEMGVVVCFQPSFAASDSPHALSALDDRVDHAYPWRRLLDAGARLIAGSDFPIEDLSPLAGLLRLVSGAAVGDTLPVEQAMQLLTGAESGSVTLSHDPQGGSLDDLRVLATTPVE